VGRIERFEATEARASRKETLKKRRPPTWDRSILRHSHASFRPH